MYFLIRARASPPPSFGQCPKENIFFYMRCSLNSQTFGGLWRKIKDLKARSMRNTLKSPFSSVVYLTKIRLLFPHSSCILSVKLPHCTPDMPQALTRQRFSSAPDFSPVILPKDEGKHKRVYNRLKGKMCTSKAVKGVIVQSEQRSEAQSGSKLKKRRSLMLC